jgi:acyl-CoA hydrolase
VPIYLSEIPNLFRRNILPVDVALVQVSPPDKHGYCSLGAFHTPIYRQRL